MAMTNKASFLPAEVANYFRYSVSFTYGLIRTGKVKAVMVRGQIRMPREEVCVVFCQGTGNCPDCSCHRSANAATVAATWK